MFKYLIKCGCDAYFRFAHVTRIRWQARSLFARVEALVQRVRSSDIDRPIVAMALVEHLGDIVASEPIARHIRLLHPDAFLVWVTRPTYREVLVGHPAIDDVFSVNCLTEWQWLKRRGVFHRIYDLHIDRRVCGLCQIPLDNAEGDPSITLDNYYQHGNLLAVFSRCAGVSLDPSQAPQLAVSADIANSADLPPLPPSYLVVHCASNEAARDWETEKWVRLLQELGRATDCHVVETGTFPRLASAGLLRYTNLCGKLHILQTAELIRRAKLFIGVDSAPAHIANAVGTPGVLIFGHYRRFTRYLPYSGDYGMGKNVDIIFADGPAAQVSVEDVMGRILCRLAMTDEIGM